ncbi:MAG: hypothetical protein WAM14_13500 [Candidatus Nitrosopolaris sp.]
MPTKKESTRFDTEGMHWKDKAQIFIPELQMNWEQARSALKKSWKSYR